MASVQASSSINIALGLSLNQLISLIIILQYLVFSTGFNLRYPANYENIINPFVEVAQFEVFPNQLMEKYNEILKFTETIPYSLGLERLKYESKNFVNNAGSCLIILYLMILGVLIYGILTAIQKCRQSTLVDKMRRRLSSSLLWNKFIDFFMGG